MPKVLSGPIRAVEYRGAGSEALGDESRRAVDDVLGLCLAEGFAVSDIESVSHGRDPLEWAELPTRTRSPRRSGAVKARRSRLAEHGAPRRAHGLDGENGVVRSEKTGQDRPLTCLWFECWGRASQKPTTI